MSQIDRRHAVERLLQIDEPGLAVPVNQEIARMGIGADQAERDIGFALGGEMTRPRQLFGDRGAGAVG